MPVLARFVKQRRVNRNALKARYKNQRRNWRGSTKGNLPTLASISPTTAVKNTAAFTLTCTGTNYLSGVTKITVNGGVYPTTYVSATSVTMQFTPPATAQTVSINVQNGALTSVTPRTLTIT